MHRRSWIACLVVGCAIAGCSSRRNASGEHQVVSSPLATAGEVDSADRLAAPEGEAPDPRTTVLHRIGSGSYRSFFPGKDEPKQARVEAFQIEEHAVTNGQFARFVRAVPKWRRPRAKRLFADSNYLMHWATDVDPGENIMDCPVVNVSWFAARAYAHWIGRRLPSLQEWEFVAAASETAKDGSVETGFNQRILDWYAKATSPNQKVRSTFQNIYGAHDMHGLVWEWVENFNSALVTGESRGDTSLERSLFCGAGSIGSANPADYASFMRFAFRSSLKGSYTTKNLGFRCAVGGGSAKEDDK